MSEVQKGHFGYTKGIPLSGEHKQKLSKAMTGKKQSVETIRKRSETIRGRKRPPFSLEWRRKLGDSRRGKPRPDLCGKGNPMWGKHASKEIRLKISKALKGRKLTDEHRRKISETQLGEKSSNWKGGRKAIHERIRDSWKYRKWRKDVFIRDNFICLECGQRGGYLEAHHKKPFKVLLDEVEKYLPLFDLYGGAMMYEPFWDLGNGITYCKKCHDKYTLGGGVRWRLCQP